MKQDKLLLSWVEHEKSLITSRPGFIFVHFTFFFNFLLYRWVFQMVVLELVQYLMWSRPAGTHASVWNRVQRSGINDVYQSVMWRLVELRHLVMWSGPDLNYNHLIYIQYNPMLLWLKQVFRVIRVRVIEFTN